MIKKAVATIFLICIQLIVSSLCLKYVALNKQPQVFYHSHLAVFLKSYNFL